MPASTAHTLNRLVPRTDTQPLWWPLWQPVGMALLGLLSAGLASTAMAAPPTGSPGCPASAMGAATGVSKPSKTPMAQLPLNQRPAALSAALGLPPRVLIGLGTVDFSLIQRQDIKVDIYDQYINGVGPQSWISWNSPSGAYIPKVAANADCIGAVPMFTLYQMASNGENNLSGLRDMTFMKQYWDNVRTLFTRLRAYGKPALVNFEPDFWGYTQRIQKDPSKHFAHVTMASGDCSNLTDDVVGIAGCLVQMARKHAPNAYVGFPPSYFPDVAATELAYMKRIGADKADFAVMQTLDRDIGCMEARNAAANCNRATDAKRWDDTNATSPNFKEHFALARTYFEAMGLPLLWWQTPLGVNSPVPGGSHQAFRDNRVSYFLSHGAEIAAAGGIGAVFSPGHTSQTTITTDGGQFKRLSASYLAKPAPLP